ncbi:LamB/YcsF family protein [Streptomyces sp. NPDC020996]|uniref:LamB/YcsF family protein n=1 Tax=Streptomyces sp. NPDC020996 TaxID=3154791 RepID=UPI0033FE2992
MLVRTERVLRDLLPKYASAPRRQQCGASCTPPEKAAAIRAVQQLSRDLLVSHAGRHRARPRIGRKSRVSGIPAIEINCDMRETFGNWIMGRDEEMFPVIITADIACGFHAGDPTAVRPTSRTADQHGIAVGAHPTTWRVRPTPDPARPVRGGRPLHLPDGTLRAFPDTEGMPDARLETARFVQLPA